VSENSPEAIRNNLYGALVEFMSAVNDKDFRLAYMLLDDVRYAFRYAEGHDVRSYVIDRMAAL
jgi:hypothetical protein